MVASPSVHSENWIGGGGMWNTPAVWQEGSVPNAAGAVATFIGQESVVYTISLSNEQFTLGEINFLGGVAGGYALTSGTLVLQGAATPAYVRSANQSFSSEFGIGLTVLLATDTVFDISSPNAYLSSVSSIVGTGALIKEGLGTVFLRGANSYTDGTHVENGILKCRYCRNVR